MKNLMAFASPEKDFNDECKVLVKLQIDNSLELGWRTEDIILVTNFSYEYNGVKSFVVGDENYCAFFGPSTKIYAIDVLFEMGEIGNDLYWYHGFDCYQFHPITEAELQLDNYDMGLTNYGRMPRLCSASIFFKKDAKDIFNRLKQNVEKNKIDEERAIMRLIGANELDSKNRVKLPNITYAFHKFNLRSCYKIPTLPLRAAHFHATPDKFDFYMYGKNKLEMVLMPDRLIKLFNRYGYQ